MSNFTDLVPLLAQTLGTAGAGLSAKYGNQAGITMGNLATQFGQNLAYAYPQGLSKALGQAQASQPVVHTPGMNPSAAESLTERKALSPQNAAAMMGTAPSSTGANLSPLAAMMMSPEQQNAMSKMQMERASQPGEIAYRDALAEQANTQTAAVKQSMFGMSPLENAKLDLQKRSLDLEEKARNAQINNDEARSALYRQEYERNNQIYTTINALQTAQDPSQKVRLMEELLLLDPTRATAMLKDQSKVDPIFKMVWGMAEEIMKANEGITPGKSDPKVAASKAIQTLREIGSALSGKQQPAQTQQQTPNKIYDERSGEFVSQ